MEETVVLEDLIEGSLDELEIGMPETDGESVQAPMAIGTAVYTTIIHC